MAVKMAAAKALGLRGVGMWTSDATRWNKTLAAQMWASVPCPNKTAMGTLSTSGTGNNLFLHP